MIQRIRHRRSPDRFTDADPTKRLSVDPDRITYKIPSTAPLETDRPVGRVADGPWDRHRIRITERTFYQSLESVYVDGANWESTEYYRAVLDAIESGQRRWGCSSPADLESKCSHVDTLYEALQSEGYHGQRELVARGEERFPLRDPLVAIGRDGTILHLRDGNHRIGLSKLLELESITVRVGPRHAHWQRIRDAIADADTVADLEPSVRSHRRHPDLADLVDQLV
ncbi:hypothetical protein B1756_09655 [Natrarchaeobaculum aegyptiacum]|uniref:ParB/Sulfiredoxin domain-containing protein n=2 Tax=Natrarchaeobaculum aegyptiacum TaxID=745377 RepID=A0A2Z2I0Z3_9EURY|nr:hypothetical protein B1756_09655 [Natrarchaeobaculum aegyptiacum]